MNRLLLSRETGYPGPGPCANILARLHLYQLLRSFSPAAHISFDGGESGTLVADGAEARPNVRSTTWAHQSGASCLALERFDGRVLISGGTDASIKIWDLEQKGNPHDGHVYTPAGVIRRAPKEGRNLSGGHKFGVTKLSFYPFDSQAFLSSSHDGCLKLWATERAELGKSLELGGRIFTHAISPVAGHLLVACGTVLPAVRLVDLRAGAAVHALPAPGAGPMVSMAWSPRWDHVLLSGSGDGVVRVWDVRRAGGPLGVLDMDDGAGMNGDDSVLGSSVEGSGPLKKAHTGPVNGISWTDDGSLIITAGQDGKIRVWDADTGANTFAAFGPLVRNGGQLGSQASMFVTPTGVTPSGRDILYWGNDGEIIAFDLREGTVLSRLRGTGPSVSSVSAPASSSRGSSGAGPSERQQRATAQTTTTPAASRSRRSVRNRLTGLVWRGAGGYGQSSGTVPGGRTAAGGMYSSHLDGQIRMWMPEMPGNDEDEEGEEEMQGDAETRKRKRKVLDDAYRSLMGTSITFSGQTASG
ncbi:hypothetical protein MKZ38_001429 [Zalerion maritima]|uniref:DNA excision repair protein ERCC-8 n=1 Tax=Zalerion maritima TaxID=339359 RepID=A0AAD5RRR7_9PEZI|nr:hypothetical protein MKZ38_001429 [Zalerion maritima]